MKSLGSEQWLADACVWRLVEDGAVSTYAVVDVDDIFTAGHKSRCHRLCYDLNGLVPINNVGERTYYGGCHYSRDTDNGLLSIWQNAFEDKVVDTWCIGSWI